MRLALKSTIASAMGAVSSLLIAASAASAARGSGTGLSGMRPDPSAIPGGAQAKTVLDGIMFWGLLAAAGALVACAAMMGWGKLRRNPHHVESGQTGMLWAIGGAIVIGGASAFISWAFNLGSQIQ